jgi:transposase
MVLRPAGTANSCPVCQRRSDRIHSWYRRRLNDLPWEGIPVRIELQVRRFFCGSDGCPQRIFTERLPKTASRYARRTSRLSFAIEQITLALGGSAGSRLAEQLGILASDSTLLRQLRRKTVDEAITPRVLGIDYWAWRKGHRYGTILCDLERGKVIDLLANRSAESTERRLRAYPGTEVISRDRASLYAQMYRNSSSDSVVDLLALRMRGSWGKMVTEWPSTRLTRRGVNGALRPECTLREFRSARNAAIE